jgi:hypothetical protein
VLEWCATCERRLLQLESLQERLRTVDQQAVPRRVDPRERPDPSKTRDISDRELLDLVKRRVLTSRPLAKEIRRGVNSVLHAALTGAIPSFVIGRTRLIPRDSARLFFEAIPRKAPLRAAGQAVVAALPRLADEAIPAREVAKRSGQPLSSVYMWLSNQRERPELLRVPTQDARGRAVLAYWWKETSA